MRSRQYSHDFDVDVRSRVRFRLNRGQVVGFIAQLEFQYKGEWEPVIRFDNAHGFAHCDEYKPDGTVLRHQPMPVQDLNLALTLATKHIKENWESLCRPFRRRRSREDD